MLADVRVAFGHGDVLRHTIVKRYFDAKLQPRPKGKVWKKLNNESLFLDRIYKIYRIIILFFKSCQSC